MFLYLLFNLHKSVLILKILKLFEIELKICQLASYIKRFKMIKKDYEITETEKILITLDHLLMIITSEFSKNDKNIRLYKKFRKILKKTKGLFVEFKKSNRFIRYSFIELTQSIKELIEFTAHVKFYNQISSN